MKEKIYDYIEKSFSDAPDCKKTKELKEELYQNVCDKYDDLIREGKTKAEAYNISVLGIGDVSEIISSIKEEYYGQTESCQNNNAQNQNLAYEEYEKKMRKYKIRSAIVTAIAVALFMACWLPLVLFNESLNIPSNGVLRLVVMVVIIIIATVILIINAGTEPKKPEDPKKSEDPEQPEEIEHDGCCGCLGIPTIKKKKHPVLKVLCGVSWTLAFIAYLIISFLTGAWFYTWLIFVIAGVINCIMGAFFQLLETDRKYAIVKIVFYTMLLAVLLSLIDY